MLMNDDLHNYYCSKLKDYRISLNKGVKVSETMGCVYTIIVFYIYVVGALLVYHGSGPWQVKYSWGILISLRSCA